MPDTDVYIVDKPATVLASEINDQLLSNAERFALEKLQPILDTVLQWRFSAKSVGCRAPEAGEILKESIQLLTEELERWAQGYSAIRWLWMLRRLPRQVFEGKLASTQGYDQALAEIISARSTSARQDAVLLKPSSVNPSTLSYSLIGAVVKRLAQFCQGVRFLSHLHQSYRWAGKGASFVFEAGKIPQLIADSDLRSAVAIYDRRVIENGRPLSRLGSSVVAADVSEGSDAILWIHQVEPIDYPIPLPGVPLSEAVKERKMGKTKAKFLPDFLSFSSFDRLLSDNRIDASRLVTPEIASLFYLLSSAIALINRHHSGFAGLVKTGYLIFDKDRCFSILHQVYDQVSATARQLLRSAEISSADEVISVLTNLKGSDWPLGAGPVFRHEGQMICVDLASATHSLHTLLEFPAIQGEFANARAEHFEDAVQAVIDASPWQPQWQVRSIRRRRIARDNRVITDIDAIGEREGTLILVSCKSLIYSGRYDAGEYAIVRNAAQLVKEAVDRWETIVNELSLNRSGNNYDFSMFHTIIGVVCTPHPVYVNIDIANRYAANGLCSCASISELAKWLGVDSRFPW